MITRRIFSALIGAASIGSLIPKSTRAIETGNRILCDKCNRFVPDHLAMWRSNQPYDAWWQAALGSQYNVLCLVCVDHRICYPYFERAYFSERNEEKFCGITAGPFPREDDNSPWYQSLMKAEHDCCITKQLKELNQFYGQ